ncbi:S8 family peptidase [Aquabacterium sp.]|uniref:S8 family peptidase n=1 Tax=Aquabacterium sp. TaxID=1872578 RepID=UPI002CA5D76B|nr:S8 family serine peptidase [Aquabacterium sp.]HSW03031.1 S8 family serine peptidase [Aquabacterium sp.]
MSIEDLLTHRRAAGVLVRLASTAPGDMKSLATLFDAEAGSRGAMLSAGAARGRRRGAAAAQPMLVFPRLGLAYGAVTRDGLEAMRKHKAVTAVSEANSLRMIRPIPYTASAAASAPSKPEKGPTWGIRALKVDALWAEGLSGAGVLIGHLDTGIDGAHPVLDQAIEKAAVFDMFGQEGKASKPPTDSDDHGTHTAGTIAGRPFKKVHVGVAPKARLLTAEVIEGGDAIARVLGGMEWALQNGARVLNLSLGWPNYVDSFLSIIDALRANECLPVIAAGNEGEGSTRSPGNYVQALSVGAAGPSARVPGFSGSEVMVRDVDSIVPDIVAPGVDIWSAAPGGGFQRMQGTSMATPHVAGLAALLFEAFPDASVAQVESAIFASARRSGHMPETRAGRGMPDAVLALAALKLAVASGENAA